jgi:hypothetical protein
MILQERSGPRGHSLSGILMLALSHLDNAASAGHLKAWLAHQ